RLFTPDFATIRRLTGVTLSVHANYTKPSKELRLHEENCPGHYPLRESRGTCHRPATRRFFARAGAGRVGRRDRGRESKGVEKSVVTNDGGNYTITGLAPGKYTVRAINAGFALTETPDVEVTLGKPVQFDITLKVAIEEQKVTVAADTRELSTEPENNAGAVVMKGADLDALPDDPDDLAAALQALAGPSAGPNGGQIFVDGFTGGRLPPRASIREIRINSNPFSAEYDRLGFGRIEILTRPGTD